MINQIKCCFNASNSLTTDSTDQEQYNKHAHDNLLEAKPNHTSSQAKATYISTDNCLVPQKSIASTETLQTSNDNAIEQSLALAERKFTVTTPVMDNCPKLDLAKTALQIKEHNPDIMQWLELIEKLQHYDVAYALYRLPRHQDFHLILSQKCLSFNQWQELCQHSGFVFAPFDLNSGHPLVLIEPQIHAIGLKASYQALQDFFHTTNLKERQAQDLPAWAKQTLENQRLSYKQSFSKLKQALVDEKCSKLVLSRAAAYNCHHNNSLGEYFLKACKLYPNLMVSLSYTPFTGTWLGSTPEVLLSGSQAIAKTNQESTGTWHTMSLAGTMPLPKDGLPPLTYWSDKNRHEQAIVTQFLANTLIPWTKELHFTGPYTAQAGALIHLKTDVAFKLQNDADLPKVLQQLHPTPAVCGMPKLQAYQLINQLEHYDRGYYAGALGLMGVSSEFVCDNALNQDCSTLPCNVKTTKTTAHSNLACHHTQLFVNLRCMQFYTAHKAICYAGGGILTESDELSEFQETQRKMETMRNLLEPPFNLSE